MLKDEHLDFWIDNNYNALFKGKHGTGKTTRIIEAFERAGLKWKYFSASTMDPWVDLVGVPKEIKEGGKSYLDLVRPKEFQDDEVEALFFDEYNRSSKKVRNAVMELIQFKSINGKKYNNLRIVWAAVNPDDDEDEEYDVEKIDPAQEDRFHIKVDIPYTPSKKYFKNKYGAAKASAAIEWWGGLPNKIKNEVSPRRLDYALDVYLRGGDINYVLPAKSNVSKLVQILSFGSVVEKLKEFQQSNDISGATKFLKIENNYNTTIDFILRKNEFKDFFLPLLEKEKIAKIIYKDDKMADYFVKKSSDNQKYIEAIKDILNARTNIKKTNLIKRKIRTNGLNNTFFPQLPKTKNNLDTTYERVKRLRMIIRNVNSTGVCGDTNIALEELRDIEYIVRRSQQTYTLRKVTGLKDTIDKYFKRLGFDIYGNLSVRRRFPNISRKTYGLPVR